MTKQGRTPLELVEQRMRECSAQSDACKSVGDEGRMYQLNVAWHWLDALRIDLMETADAELTGEKS